MKHINLFVNYLLPTQQAQFLYISVYFISLDDPMLVLAVGISIAVVGVLVSVLVIVVLLVIVIRSVITTIT